MNKTRRKEIEKAIGALEEIKENIEGLQEEEQEAFDNMPEGLQDSERGEAVQENADQLDEAATYIGDAIDLLQEVIDR